MAAHAYHPDLPGFIEGGVLTDGCPECDKRALSPISGLASLDGPNLFRIWRLMIDKEFRDATPRMSRGDMALVSAAYACAQVLEKSGIDPHVILRNLSNWMPGDRRDGQVAV